LTKTDKKVDIKNCMVMGLIYMLNSGLILGKKLWKSIILYMNG